MELIRDLVHLLGRCEYDELIASDAGDEGRGENRRLQMTSNDLKNPIPLKVTKCAIRIGKAIDVSHQHGPRRTRATGFDVFAKSATIWQTGQRICKQGHAGVMKK